LTAATGTKTRKERGAPRACELVNSVKNMCQLKRPEVGMINSILLAFFVLFINVLIDSILLAFFVLFIYV
jgi:hypothetical protein